LVENHYFIAQCYPQRGLCRRKMSVRLSVTRWYFVEMAENISSNFLHDRVATPF